MNPGINERLEQLRVQLAEEGMPDVELVSKSLLPTVQNLVKYTSDADLKAIRAGTRMVLEALVAVLQSQDEHVAVQLVQKAAKNLGAKP